MVTEKQKYISGVLRALGFALFTPMGTILFQQLVFEKALFRYFSESVVVFLTGWIFVALGYCMLREKK